MLTVVKDSKVSDGSHGPDDRQLALRARDGDEDAFAALVQRHSGGLHRAVSRVLCDDAEAWDVVQMAFLKAWQSLNRYNPKWSFATWAYRIGTNLAIDVIRARKSRDRAHQAGTEHRLRLVGTFEPTSAKASQSDADRVLNQVLPALSPQQRAAFVLREVEGLETSEVATALGCSPTTVRNHVFQARKTLKAEIAKHFPEYLPASRRT
jgi:RNA polymerase sigma-70 factor (ECF subfamily)